MVMISLSKSSILFLLLVAILATKQAAAQPPTKPSYYTEFCRSKIGNYTTNSTYEANVISVLNDLYAQSTNLSFSTASAGLSSNQVFGQYYCRGDINASLCNECVNEAAQTVFINCHNFKSAVVWFGECTLRYDNVSMVGVEAELPLARDSAQANVTDPEEFGPVVNKTMARLISESAYGNLSSSFATGEGVVSRFETVYCLVQCSPDINGTQCDTCLRFAYDYIPNWGPQIVVVLSPSCRIMYSTQGAFYQARTASPPPEAIAPTSVTPASPSLTPPPPAKTSSPPTGGTAMLGSRESLNLGLVILALFFTSIRFG